MFSETVEPRLTSAPTQLRDKNWGAGARRLTKGPDRESAIPFKFGQSFVTMISEVRRFPPLEDKEGSR